ncbi:hypothetical protein BGZ51_004899 [Haplosporangium sp. Z 767]|nr:hypothetical protein BGZ51_004899 [Haplosporangium sp. Z 767]KAF9192197.1 hypothetical protein BGZ50_008715 [Haplosporangium sp. Z 11]
MTSFCLLFLATLLALATTALAGELTLTSPIATTFATATGELPITWTYSGEQPTDPPAISVELVDNSKKLFSGPLALFSGVNTVKSKVVWSVPKMGFVGNNFTILLVAKVNEQAVVFAQSPVFSIKEEGTLPPPTPTEQPTTKPESSTVASTNNALKNRAGALVLAAISLCVCMAL